MSKPFQWNERNQSEKQSALKARVIKASWVLFVFNSPSLRLQKHASWTCTLPVYRWNTHGSNCIGGKVTRMPWALTIAIFCFTVLSFLFVWCCFKWFKLAQVVAFPLVQNALQHCYLTAFKTAYELIVSSSFVHFQATFSQLSVYMCTIYVWLTKASKVLN